MTRHRSRWTIFRSGLEIVVMVAFAIIAQGCATRQDRSQELGSTGDYLAQEQNDRYPYGYYPYDPYMIGYDPYWGWWYPAPSTIIRASTVTMIATTATAAAGLAD